jgi:hypothetical protein
MTVWEKLGYALVVFGVTAWLQTALFESIPHVTDETSHWFQAKLFAEGQLYAPTPPCPEAFAQHNVVMTTDGRWFSKYPPGQALWLALGKRLGAVEWMMPVAAAMGLLGFLSLLLYFYPAHVVRWCALAWIVSPQILLLGASYMSHSLCLAASLWGAVWLWRSWTAACAGCGIVWAVASGLAWSAAFITRPQDAALAGVVILVISWRRWLMAITWQRQVPALLIGALPLLAFFLYRNQVLYGDALLIGYYLPDHLLVYPLISDTFGFNADHTPARAVQYLIWSLYRLNFSLLGWPLSFLLIPFAVLHPRFRAGVPALLLAAVIPILFYLLHSYYGLEYEARYYLFSVPPLLILTVLGGMVLWTDDHRWPTWHRVGRGLLAVWLIVASIYAATVYWPGRVWPEYGRGYEQTSMALADAVVEAGLEQAVVLVPSGNWHRDYRYSAGFIHNDPHLQGDVLYARDRPANRTCLAEAFPDRAYYRAIQIGPSWRLQRIPVSDAD